MDKQLLKSYLQKRIAVRSSRLARFEYFKTTEKYLFLSRIKKIKHIQVAVLDKRRAKSIEESWYEDLSWHSSWWIPRDAEEFVFVNSIYRKERNTQTIEKRLLAQL